MKKTFLLLSLIMGSMCSFAQKVDMNVERMQPTSKVALAEQQLQTKQLAKGIIATSVNTPSGIVNKIGLDMRVKSTEVNSQLDLRLPQTSPATTPLKASADASLYEGFEGANLEDVKWVPEGWSRIDKCQVQNTSNWHADNGAGTFGTTPYAGTYQMSINNPMSFEGDNPDEWLISPVFTCKEGHNLSFQLKSCPAWLFDTSYMDFAAWAFTELSPLGDVKVYARVEGTEDWTVIWSQVEATIAMSTLDLDDLYTNMDGKYFQYDVDMSAYTGKNIQIAFHYVCPLMGDNICLDEVAVDAMPTPVSYEMPQGAYFWSYSNLFQAIASYKLKQYPVYQPLTWKSNYGDNVSFAYWEFRNPESQNDFSMDKDLTITFHSDYSNDFNTVANLYNNPTLNASAPGYSDGSYQDPECDIISVGGVPSWISGSNHLTFTSSMVPFSAGSQEIKDTSGRPLFGYATENNADDFWKNTLLADATDDDKLYVEKLMALYDAPARSAVIDSVCVFAVANVSADAKLHAMICAVEADGTVKLNDPIAEGTCLGSDAYKLYPNKEVSETSFTIAFDKPVVVDGEYVIIVDGFRGPGFTYFNPMMSVYPREDRAAMIMKLEAGDTEGYVLRYSSILATSLGQLKSAFYINPYLTYPYLVDTDETIQTVDEPVVLGEEEVVMSFDSFYPAEKYTVTAPGWVSADLNGCYDNFKLTLKAKTSASAKGDVIIECPGEKKVISVATPTATAISEVANGEVVNTEYIDAAGRIVATPVNGMYIVRNTYGDGTQTINKVIKK